MVVRFTDEQVPFVHVGHYGEAIAAEYFDADPNIGGTFGSGYDFMTPDGRRVEVKTLKRNEGKTRNLIVNSTARLRGEANVRKHGDRGYGYDVLFALRMDAKLRPIEALVIPRSVIAALPGSVTWSRALQRHPDVTHLEWDSDNETWVPTHSGATPATGASRTTSSSGWARDGPLTSSRSGPTSTRS